MLRFGPTSLSLIAAVVVLAACNGDGGRGGGDAYDGTYMVTSHTRNDLGCEAPGEPVLDGYQYFRLERASLFGQRVLGWHDCESATLCEEDLSLTGSFVTIDGEWRMRSTYSSGGTDCSVGMNDGTIEETAEGIHIEIRSYTGSFTVPTEDDCVPELAEERMDELTCDSVEIVDAARI